MLAIRLTRTGKKNDPHYRIVVQEKRSKLNGKAVDIVGHYHPATPGKALVIDSEKAKKWLSVGAQPSDTVTNLFVKEGLLAEDKKVHQFFTPTKKEEAPAEEPVATAEEATEPAAETETEATPAEESTEEESTSEEPAPEVAE